MMNRKYIPLLLVGAGILAAAVLVGGASGTAWVFVLVALLCPLMMMFMMGGMRGRGSGGASGNGTNANDSDMDSGGN